VRQSKPGNILVHAPRIEQDVLTRNDNFRIELGSATKKRERRNNKVTDPDHKVWDRGL
jgi:hypothetical protein